jgi:hypothetical protein
MAKLMHSTLIGAPGFSSLEKYSPLTPPVKQNRGKERGSTLKRMGKGKGKREGKEESKIV